MFPLHDRTRRKIALAAFGTLCVLPTALLLLWGLLRHTPWHTAAEVRRLEGILGLHVRVDRAQNTKPGVWRYEGFSLYDPETGRRLLRCEELEARYWRHGSSAPGALVLRAHGPVAHEPAAAALYQLLSRAMQGQMGTAPLDVLWTADELVFRNGAGTVHLAGLSGGTQSHPGGVKAHLRFHPAGGEGTEPAHIELHRNRQVTPPVLEVKLYTGAVPLPCRLLAVGLPAFEPLGPDSRFLGYLRADQTPQGWRGELTGQFSNVDLGRLGRESFARRWTGVGRVTIEHARFDAGRVVEARGTVAAGPGTIERRWLDAAVEQLGLLRSTPPGFDDPVSYRQLAAGWRIHAGGLHLKGQCTAACPGTLLVGTEPWQVGEPVVQPLPVAAVVRALLPHGTAEVPATPQAAWLLRRLPLPEPAPDAPARRTAERLR